MKRRQVTLQKGDKRGTIDELIQWLEESKQQGATHYYMWWSQDPDWSFKWIETYREVSEDELKQERIDKLESELDQLKNK